MCCRPIGPALDQRAQLIDLISQMARSSCDLRPLVRRGLCLAQLARSIGDGGAGTTSAMEISASSSSKSRTNSQLLAGRLRCGLSARSCRRGRRLSRSTTRTLTRTQKEFSEFAALGTVSAAIKQRERAKIIIGEKCDSALCSQSRSSFRWRRSICGQLLRPLALSRAHSG